MNIPTLVMFTVGALLIYSAVTGKSPIEVVKTSLGQTPKPKPQTGSGSGGGGGGGGPW